jgi:hypothetical protein
VPDTIEPDPFYSLLFPGYSNPQEEHAMSSAELKCGWLVEKTYALGPYRKTMA